MKKLIIRVLFTSPLVLFVNRYTKWNLFCWQEWAFIVLAAVMIIAYCETENN
jgi:hypothetical protein